MEWVNDAWVQVSAFVVAATIVALALKKFWQAVIVPLWAAMKGAVTLGEIHATVVASKPILDDLCKQFKPNGGLTVSDHITALTRGQQDLARSVDEIKNLVETHIGSTRRGGRRYTDPQ